jgi:hypothetical protein
MLAEAGGFGLQKRAVPQTVGQGEAMRVHRLQASEDLGPVLAKADAYLTEGHLYAYQQIVMLALLCVTRSIPLPRLAKRMVRSVLEHAATAVIDLLPIGASWMICSEYVYRCYSEALDSADDAYTLLIGGVDFAAADPALIDWALDNVREVPVTPSLTFGSMMPADPVQRVAAIEASLAPLIADYAAELHAAGVVADDDLPPMLDVSFGPPPVLPPEPTDDELLASMAAFGDALATAAGAPPAVAPTFGGGALATIGAAALKGALEGIKNISVDPNFVTPRDLLQTPSLLPIGRIG